MRRALLAALLLAAAPASAAGPASADDCADGAACFDGALARSGSPNGSFGAAGGVVADARAFRPAARPVLTLASASGPRTGYVPNDAPTVTASEAGSGVIARLRAFFGGGLTALERLTRLRVLARAAWNQLTPVNPFDPSRPGRMTIHHTADLRANADTSAEALQRVYDIQREHRRRGYDDIGYNFLIDPSGRVIEGRGAEVQGSHSGLDQNAGNVGISLMGHFEREDPTQAQIDAVTRLGGFLVYAYSIDARPDAFLVGHRDVPNAQTVCPGARGEARLPAWRVSIRRSAVETADAAAAAGVFSPRFVARPAS